MKVKFINMCSRKDNGTLFFAILPTITIACSENQNYLYFAWLNYLIVIEI